MAAVIFHSTPTYMTDYPFIVMAPRSRLVKIAAEKFSNALSKALSLHPNKFLKTQFARRMDLVSAQEEAKKKSQKSGHKQYVILLKSGDFEVENALSIEPKMDIYSVWHKGKKVDGPVAKIKLSPQDEEPPVAKAPKRAELPTKKELVKEVKQTNKETKQKEQNEKISKTKNEEIMNTTKSSAKKVVAKKEAPKKLAKAEKSTTPAKGKKPASIKKIEGAKIVAISIKDMRAGIKKGIKYYDPQGVSQNETYLASRANQDYIREGMQELKPSK